MGETRHFPDSVWLKISNLFKAKDGEGSFGALYVRKWPTSK